MTMDVENHALNQLPTLIKFLLIVPVEFDSEIIESAVIEKENKLKKKAVKMEGLSLQERFEKMRLLAIGCSRGSVVFLNIDDMEHIHTRITYHRA